MIGETEGSFTGSLSPMGGQQFELARTRLGLPARWIAREAGVSAARLYRAELGRMPIPQSAWEVLHSMENEANALAAQLVERARDDAPAPIRVFLRDRSFWAAFGRYRDARVPATFHHAIAKRLAEELGLCTTACQPLPLVAISAPPITALADERVALARALQPIFPDLVGEFLLRLAALDRTD